MIVQNLARNPHLTPYKPTAYTLGMPPATPISPRF